MALAHINRAKAGLTVLLELLHASERVRVDGDDAQQVEYVNVQVHAA